MGAVLICVLYTFINAGIEKFGKQTETIVVASKDYTEQELMGNILLKIKQIIKWKEDFHWEEHR